MSKFFIGDVCFDDNERLLRRGEVIVSLEPKVAHLLQIMCNASGEVVSRERILAEIYSLQVVGAGSINRLISKLRKNFAQFNSKVEYIKTIPKTGYKLQFAATCIDALVNQKNKRQSELCRFESSTGLVILPHLKRSMSIRLSRYFLVTAFFLMLVLSLRLAGIQWQSNDIVNCLPSTGWFLSGSNSTDYRTCLDTDFGVPSPSAMMTHRVEQPQGFATLMQYGWDESYRGKHYLDSQ